MALRESARKWVQALRSGEYKQGIGALKGLNKDGEQTYCCLGVACDIYAKETGLAWEVRLDGSNRFYFLGKTGLLPYEVQKWLGLKTDDGLYRKFSPDDHYGCTRTLTGDNDGSRFTFEEIASLIESEPEGLFRADPEASGV